jgi:hypothetical protein
MPRIELDHISDSAYTWVFGLSPRLDAAKEATLLRAVDVFLARWAAHGQPITSAREIKDGSFLVIAAESDSERSGCSIDRLFGTLRGLESELGVSIVDANRVFYRSAEGSVEAASREGFARTGRPNTVVFDTTAESLGDIRSGRWERPAADSWHRHLLKSTTSVI